VVAEDRPEALADAILRVVTADAAQLDAWSTNAAAAARGATWAMRADRIVDLLAAGGGR
jgi:hypothetical protein